MLYTTHYMEEAQELSNRVGIIDHGELIALGTQAELTRQVGENDTLILHIGESENGEALARGGPDRSPGVLNADVTDHTVTVIAPEAEEIMAPVITMANALGIKIRSVDIQEPDLEAVFLHADRPGAERLTIDTCKGATRRRPTGGAMKKLFLIGWKDLQSCLPRPGGADPDAARALPAHPRPGLRHRALLRRLISSGISPYPGRSGQPGRRAAGRRIG